MRVLDLGSGAGDVALLATEMVGPTGEVVGVDVKSKVLEVARKRLRVLVKLIEKSKKKIVYTDKLIAKYANR